MTVKPMDSLQSRQTRGLIAVSLFMAIIPFIVFFTGRYSQFFLPPLINQNYDNSAVELIVNGVNQGIYFTPPTMSLSEFLSLTDIRNINTSDIPLKNAMHLVIKGSPGNYQITSGKMSAATRLALNIPVDINEAGRDDLLLITGIGEITANQIINLREKKGRFKKLEDLMQIKGIKEKKLEKLRKYLCVES